ncbi:PREDICTED: zinc finger and BTB domain-containing protein 49-like [Branchiostoma belcheri]|uniref:Zinc finger and BTB domain-containing protein 49-like n=1 Tax=Branchiostoma belcheri TaxID=7741 RepID=A0A6P5A9J6_BRABE|nr:PREDICTED: zinc finger and BTB domain-containing protein 49-like [Branchiostoma belcheri]
MAATKETTFKFPNMAASFVKHLNDMRQRGQLCDLTVVVMGMQFPCHRAVLAASSSYFRSVFTSGGEVPNELHLPTLKIETFSKILDFMYTHKLTLNAGNTGDILVAATMLNLENVVDVCSQYLKRSMASMAMAVNSSETLTATACSSTEGGFHDRARQAAPIADSQEDGIDYFGSSTSFQSGRSVGSSRVESPSANPHSTGSPHRKDPNPHGQWDMPVLKVEQDQMDPSEDSSTSSTAGVEARSAPMQAQSRFTAVRERAVDTTGDGLQLQPGVTSWSTDGNVLQRDGSATLSAAPTHDQYSPTLQVPGTAKRTDDLGKVYYACPVCDSTFTWKSSLQRHMHNHSMWRRHVCQVCGKSFARMDVLKDHMLLHLAEKPHKCDICGRKFTHKKNLKMHVMRHMGGSPMTCKICHYRYATVAGLRNHMKIKHDTELVEAQSPDGDRSPQGLAAPCGDMASSSEPSSVSADQNTPMEESGNGPEDGLKQEQAME